MSRRPLVSPHPAAGQTPAPRRPANPHAEIDVPRLPPRRREYPWVRRGLAFATCVLLANALFGEGGLGELLRGRRQYEAARMELAALREENAMLRNRARRLVGDTATIEGVARDELGLLKRGEVLVTVRDLEPNVTSR